MLDLKAKPLIIQSSFYFDVQAKSMAAPIFFFPPPRKELLFHYSWPAGVATAVLLQIAWLSG